MSLYTGILNEFVYWKKWSDEDFRNEEKERRFYQTKLYRQRLLPCITSFFKKMKKSCRFFTKCGKIGSFWHAKRDSNPRPSPQEQTRYDETKCNTVQENPWKYKVFHCFKSYLVLRFISIFIGILHRPIGSKLARLSIFGGRCKCKQIPLCNLSLYEMIGNPIHSRTGLLVFWTPI